MVRRSSRLDGVNYEIRGPVYDRALAMEKEGQSIIRLHIGNPAPFGFDTPEPIRQAIVANLAKAQGYAESKGTLEAREAIRKYYSAKGVAGVHTENIFVGNGVSDLILMGLQGLLEPGDEVLLPTPDYPLWTSAVRLHGGRPVHYRCDEAADWYPDPADIRRQITSRTRALVLINPNNPTGAVYSDELLVEILDIAREHGLLIFSDEIYDKILYDGVTHTPTAALAPDVVCVTMSGLTKNYRAAGFRAGWLLVSGPPRDTASYVEGLTLLANMRVCSNAIAQQAIKTALEGYQCIDDLVLPAGRLRRQRDLAVGMIRETPGLSCTVPKGAFYLFAKMDLERFDFQDDTQFVIDLLTEEKVLVVQGSGFNHPTPDHFRVVFLPTEAELSEGLRRIGSFLRRHTKVSASVLEG
jgi:alanine-synthesizing transaminase